MRKDFGQNLLPPTARRSLLSPRTDTPKRRYLRQQVSAKPSTDDSAFDGPFVRDEKLVRLEAVLFLAKQPLHARKLANYANLADGTEGLTLIRRLNNLYDKTGRAFRVEEVANGWQLRTRRKFANWLRRLPHVPAELRLSPPAMETLAVVAYRQPVVRAEIETVRGVACGDILRQLMEKDLVRVTGRSEELGRPYLYCTTNTFLQMFGLRALEELPRSAILQEAMKSGVAAPANMSQTNSLDLDGEKETVVSTTTSSNAGERWLADGDDEQGQADLSTAVPSSVTQTEGESEDDEEFEYEDDDDEDDESFEFEDDDDDDDDFDDDDDEGDDDEDDEDDDDDAWEEDDDNEWEEVEDEEEEEEDDDDLEGDDWEDDDIEDDDEDEWEEGDDEGEKGEEDDDDDDWD